MKYLITILTFTVLSCNKNEDEKPAMEKPTVSNITVTSEIVGGSARPKFTFNLTIPDTAAVANFILFSKGPNAIPCIVIKPKSGTYSLTDPYNSFPGAADKKNYSSAFIMTDQTAIYNSDFTIN